MYKKIILREDMNETLKTSKDGLEMIAKWEGCVLKPYKDIAGLRTIGIGHLIKPGENFPDGVEITRERALDILADDVKICEDAIKKHIKARLNQNQFDALVSFGFNCGTGVYSNSGVATAINTGQFDQVPSRLQEWCKATVNGVRTTIKGLLNRRIHEGEVFSRPIAQTSFIIDNLVVGWTTDTLSETQKLLRDLSLYTGKIDGIFGPMTHAAIMSFASLHGLQIDDPAKGISSLFIKTLRNAS